MSRTNDDPRGERLESPTVDLERLEAENFSLRAEIKKLKAEARAADNAWVELGAIHEAMVDAIEGREPSDFMLSFPEVRAAWDLRLAASMLMAAEGEE